MLTCILDSCKSDEMKVIFENKTLALIETPEAAETRLPVAVIQSARSKLNAIRAATDERTLRNWKSLHYEKLKGDRKDQRSIRLNNKWRLIFRLNDQCTPNEIIVIGIEDYH